MKTLISLIFAVCITLSGSNVYADSAQLNWIDNSHNEDGFKIERNLNGGAFEFIQATVGANVVTFTDSTLEQSAERDNVYCYRVAAFNATGQSAYSNTACKTVAKLEPTPEPSPDAPSNLEVAALSPNDVKITWQNPGNAEIRLFRAAMQGSGSSREFVLPGGATFLHDGSLRKNTTYAYSLEPIPMPELWAPLVKAVRTPNK